MRPLPADDGAIRRRRSGALGQRLDLRAPVAARVIFLEDPEPLEAAQHDVVAAVGQPLDVRDDAAAADRIDRRPSLVVVLPARPQQHHADHPVAGERVGHHLPVPRLEDVQRQKDVRETARRSAAGRAGSRSDIGSSIDC